jgi:pilus assembly protein CpaF
MTERAHWLAKIQEAVDQNSGVAVALRTDTSLAMEVEDLVNETLANAPIELRSQLKEEYFGWGPLHDLVKDTEITEIMVNSWDSISFERSGVLHILKETFLSPITYQNFLSRLCHHINSEPNLNRPFASGRYFDFRVQMVSPPISASPTLTLRRHSKEGWTLSRLKEKNWCTENQAQQLSDLVQNRANILIAGSTGSGKTSVLNALLGEINSSERAIILEDTKELHTPNTLSLRLETRFDSNGSLQDITLQSLLKHSLRLRPDRLIVGEVRDIEAKDLVLALSTGHEGSMGTIHAATAKQALVRLEMLVQLGAPEWPAHTIRQMIQSSLQYVLITERREGARRLKSLHRIASLEDFGFTLDQEI